MHPGAAVILPLVDDEHICLIKNDRIAVSEELIELPAGTIDPSEAPFDTARRELFEETGYRAGAGETPRVLGLAGHSQRTHALFRGPGFDGGHSSA